jgi:hypothetical protein
MMENLFINLTDYYLPKKDFVTWSVLIRQLCNPHFTLPVSHFTVSSLII